MADGRLVYSTDGGDRRRAASDPPPVRERGLPDRLPDDGVVRVFREKGGRGGKTVTVVRGLPAGALEQVARDLKRHCGSGGSAKNGTVELQGDHREKIAARLEAQGFRVKLAGG